MENDSRYPIASATSRLQPKPQPTLEDTFELSMSGGHLPTAGAHDPIAYFVKGHCKGRAVCRDGCVYPSVEHNIFKSLNGGFYNLSVIQIFVVFTLEPFFY